MLGAYLIACIPVVIGAIFWLRGRNVCWQEWLGGTVLAFFVTGLFHFITIRGMIHDTETWSGQIVKTIRHPTWVERYTTRECASRDNKGNCTRHRTVVHYRTHPEHWTVVSNYGSSSNEDEVSYTFHREIVQKFGGKIESTWAYKSGFYSGDHNIYLTSKPENDKHVHYPVTRSVSFENRIKAAPSVFSYAKVPPNSGVFSYPKNEWRRSNRLLGTAATSIEIDEWDRMNSRLGPSKRVNVIAVGFGNKSADISQLQEAAWIGGKKNDLVICYGGSVPDKPEWARVCGWTEKSEVKRNLEDLFLKNKISTALIPDIENEIRKNYIIKDWHKFDYITVEPPFWVFVVLIVVMGLSQFGFWYWAHKNEFY